MTKRSEKRLGVMPDFGVSTFWLQGISTERAIHRALESGFTAFELTTGTLGIVGFPAKPNAGVDVSACDEGQRRKLKKILQPFSHLTVHASHFGVNIASAGAETRKASRDNYMKAIQFGADLGAYSVTFHPGFRERQVDDPRETLVRNLDFAREAVELARKAGTKVGFQNIPLGSPGAMRQRAMLGEIYRELDDPSWGLALDTAYVIKENPLVSGNLTEDCVLPWFREFGKRILKLHMHGLLACNPLGYLHHQPLWQDNVHDFPLLAQYIKEFAPGAPMIFKLLGRDAETALRLSIEAREQMSALFA